VDLAEAVYPTAAPGLWLLPAGECDGEAILLLARDAVPRVLDQLRPEYDFIVMDSSPVLPVADSLLLAQHADGVLFSLLQEVSRLPKVYAACQRLTQLGVRVIGAVVSGTKEDATGYGRHYAYLPGN
jgi:Mrp family chromosome partitioning ATPase